jgi:hypothetical protein
MDLTVDANGYRWPGRPVPLSKPPRLQLDRINDEQRRLARDFLSRCTLTKTTAIGSYGLKHTIEDAVGSYISNGACIQAALDLGIKAPPAYEGWSIFSDEKFHDREPLNAFVFVSRKSVRDASRAIRVERGVIRKVSRGGVTRWVEVSKTDVERYLTANVAEE